MRTALALAVVAGCWRSQPAPTEPIAEVEPISATPRDAASRPDPVTRPIDAGMPDPTRDCPTGVGVVGRIIGLQITGSATMVTVGAGQAQNVDTSWSAQLQLPPYRACLITSVAQRTTRLECGVTPDQIKAGSAFALLCPP